MRFFAAILIFLSFNARANLCSEELQTTIDNGIETQFYGHSYLGNQFHEFLETQISRNSAGLIVGIDQSHVQDVIWDRISNFKNQIEKSVYEAFLKSSRENFERKFVQLWIPKMVKIALFRNDAITSPQFIDQFIEESAIEAFRLWTSDKNPEAGSWDYLSEKVKIPFRRMVKKAIGAYFEIVLEPMIQVTSKSGELLVMNEQINEQWYNSETLRKALKSLDLSVMRSPQHWIKKTQADLKVKILEFQTAIEKDQQLFNLEVETVLNVTPEPRSRELLNIFAKARTELKEKQRQFEYLKGLTPEPNPTPKTDP